MDYTLRKIITVFAAPFILSLILLSLAGVRWLMSSNYIPGQTPTIYASGEGKVKVKPDTAEISFSVVNQGSDPGLIQASNDKKMKAAIDFLKSTGIKDDDIKTTGYNLQPQYDYDKEGLRPPRIIGYTLAQSVSVKVRELTKVGEIVGGLAGQGVNQINSVAFFVDNPEHYKNQARQEAIAKAHAQALETAAYLGVKLGRVMSFNESPVYIPGPVYREGLSGFDGKGGGGVSPIQPGTEELTISVNIAYAIR